jgi:hypothetical protein
MDLEFILAECFISSMILLPMLLNECMLACLIRKASLFLQPVGRLIHQIYEVSNAHSNISVVAYYSLM